MTNDLVKRLRRDLASGLSASIGDTQEAADRIEALEIETRFKKLQSEESACYECVEKSETATARIEKLEQALRLWACDCETPCTKGRCEAYQAKIALEEKTECLMIL